MREAQSWLGLTRFVCYDNYCKLFLYQALCFLSDVVLAVVSHRLLLSSAQRRYRARETGGRREKNMVQYQDHDLTAKIIAAAMEVHKTLGPGLLESAYKACLALEFQEMGLRFQVERASPIIYKKRTLDCGFRVDFLVEEKIVVELKSLEHILPLHKAQVLTYLRLLGKQLGLLLNFTVPLLKQGIRRCILNCQEEEDIDGHEIPHLAKP
jgi:GxxExxY protein